MIVKNIHTGIQDDVSFHSWYEGTWNKKDFELIELDIVIWQTVGPDGQRKDQSIVDRDHANRIVRKRPDRHSMRELDDEEMNSIKSQFFCPDPEEGGLPHSPRDIQPAANANEKETKAEKTISNKPANRTWQIIGVIVFILLFLVEHLFCN